MRLARKVQSGQVFINNYGAGGGVELPFGGVKRSGHGREKGFLALEEMSTTKTVVAISIAILIADFFLTKLVFIFWGIV